MQLPALRDLPYLVHTNREFGLMLKRIKPLTYFAYIEGYEVNCVVRYLLMFDRHVEAGRFKKREVVKPVPQLPHLSNHRIFYSLPREEWRIDSMLELVDRSGPWSNHREREFGTLLGYEEWQNEFWLSRLGHSRQPDRR
jgi:hypothetical protein